MPFFLHLNFMLFLLAFLWTLPCFAKEAILDHIARDFRNISGYVVQASGEEVIIDLDGSHGVAPGDVFCVLKPGRKLVHPVTGKVIGALEETKGFLKLTRIKTGYSFARRFFHGSDIGPGDPIRRYENLQAIFWDYRGNSRALGAQLEALLPWLKWESYDAAQRSRPELPAALPGDRAAIYFLLSEKQLDVRGPDFVLRHRYLLADSAAAVSPAGPSIAEPGGSEKGRIAFADKKTGGYSAGFDQVGTLGKISGTTVMSDFLGGQGRLWLAVTDGSSINAFRISDRPEPFSEVVVPYRGQVLALKWWQPGGAEWAYLAVTCWVDHKMASLIYKLESAGLTLVKAGIPRILGAFDLDGNGTPETLLGQACDRDVFYGADIRVVSLDGNRIVLTEPPLELPRRFPVLGSQIGDITGDGLPETLFIRSGSLQVYSGNERLYSSPKKMGGSISVLTYDINPTAKDVMTRSVFFEVSPVIRDIDGDGRPEILAVSSDRSSIGAPGISAGVDEGRVVAIRYADMRFHVAKTGTPAGGAVQGLAATRDAILFVVSEPGSFLGIKGESRLLSIPLAAR